MSNEIIAQLKQQNALVQTGLDADTLAVAGGGASNGSKRISIRGGVFRKVVGGKEVAAIEDRHMNVIITKMAHTASRTFYAQSYREGEKISPSCWSSDSRVPDADVKEKQASSCDQCPHSVRGAPTQCRLSWRTAVVLPDNPGGDVLQLVLPATSSFGKEDNGKYPFRPYIQMLASNNISASRVITKMQFDTKSPTPKILFSAAGIVPEDQLEVLDRQRSSREAEQAVALTVFQQDSSGEAHSEAPTVATVEIAEPVEAFVKATPDSGGDVAEIVEPIIRNPESANTEKTSDVSDIINKWAKKD
jgi:hypothetical protein